MQIKKILVSQPEPENGKSPYYDFARKMEVDVDFVPFIEVQGLSAKEFRKQKINILDYYGVFFNSRTSVDHYFRIAKEMKITVPETMKYFCMNEATAFYLQKYIVYRKRKIFHGNGKFEDLVEMLNKHKKGRLLLPLSENHRQDIPRSLRKYKLRFSKAILYRTVVSDLSHLANVNYDLLVFYSPSSIKSLLQNFPDFEQKDTKIASFGASTAKAVKDAGLRLDIQAPMPKVPSMTMAIENFIDKNSE